MTNHTDPTAPKDTYSFTTPACIVCAKTSVLELTPQECLDLDKDINIQDALPNRDADFREMVKTGTHPACWDSMFDDDEED
jgi:hypothetical protein